MNGENLRNQVEDELRNLHMMTIRDDHGEPLVTKVLGNEKYIERQNKRFLF